MLKVYGLKHCSTTRKAVNYLMENGITITQQIDIRDHPPAKELIELAFEQYEANPRKIMNTSGNLYREMNLKNQIETMSQADIIELVTQHGMLIKRPFITDDYIVSVGAKEETLCFKWLEKYKGDTNESN